MFLILKTKKGNPTSSSPITSTSVGISPQNFFTFSFKPFAFLLNNCITIPRASPKLLNLNKGRTLKKPGFSGQIPVIWRL